VFVRSVLGFGVRPRARVGRLGAVGGGGEPVRRGGIVANRGSGDCDGGFWGEVGGSGLGGGVELGSVSRAVEERVTARVASGGVGPLVGEVGGN